jgi:hypothetical protein
VHTRAPAIGGVCLFHRHSGSPRADSVTCRRRH